MSSEAAVILLLGAIALAAFGWWFRFRTWSWLKRRRTAWLDALAEDRFGLRRRTGETDEQLRARCLQSLSGSAPTLRDIEAIALELPNVTAARRITAPGIVELFVATKPRHPLTPKQEAWLMGRFRDVVPLGVVVVIRNAGHEEREK